MRLASIPHHDALPNLPPLGSTHVDAEVLGGAGDDPLGREGSGDVLQRDGRGADGAGEPDDGEALGAAEGPAVPGVDVWLRGREGERQPFRYQQPYPIIAVGFLPTNTPLKPLRDTRVLTCRMTRGDCDWYHRGIPNKLSSAVFVS